MLTISVGEVADYRPILALNNAAVPAVNDLSAEQLEQLVNEAFFLGIATDEQQVMGFLLAFLPGADYHSENYQWFSERYQNFAYTDRIVVAESARGQQIGRRLYAALEQALPDSVDALACEVNVKPPNPKSLAFHQKLGFVEVGQQDTDHGKKRVSLLVKTL